MKQRILKDEEKELWNEFSRSTKPLRSQNKINKNFRYRILIRSKKTQKIQKTLSNVLNNFKNQKEIKLAVDVDPISFN